MALSIKDAETDRVVRELVGFTGETMTDAVRVAVTERLERERGSRGVRRGVAARLHAIADECAALPILDPRTPDEIIGYDENGLPS